MLKVRKARQDDTALISGMAYSSYMHHLAHHWLDADMLRIYLDREYAIPALQQSLRKFDNYWFIALDEEDAPVGFAKLCWNRPIENEAQTGAQLQKIYLLPGKTGQGYGEQFFADLVQRAKDRGETFLWVEVLELNSQAYRFYLRQGFTPVKDAEFCLPGQKSTSHILGKAI